MVRQSQLALFGCACAIAVLITSMADAQRGHRFRRGRIIAGAPLVRVQVGAYGGVSVRAPLVAVDPGGVHVGLRRRHTPLPQHAPRPQYTAPQPVAPAPQPAPVAVVDSRPLPTAEQIAAMDDVMLLATLREMNDRLDARLTRFNTSKSWRRYLRIPEDALGNTASNPTVRLDVLQQRLTHFHNVAANPEFANIGRLPIFVATHLALDQVVGRHDAARLNSGPQLIQPSHGNFKPAERAVEQQQEEILPTPTSAVKPEATLGERSILRRASR